MNYQFLNNQSYFESLRSQPLTFQNISTKTTIIYISGSLNHTLEYNKNNTNWQTWDGNNIVLQPREIIFFRGEQFYSSAQEHFIIKGGLVSAKGNIMSLVHPDNFFKLDHVDSRQFSECFNDCTALYNAPLMPARHVDAFGYQHMYQWCENLKFTPYIIPCYSMGNFAFDATFIQCRSLENMPILPATQLTGNCYQYMFRGCKKLKKAILPATQITANCYQYMFAENESLQEIKVNFTNWESGTFNWVTGTPAKNVKFICPQALADATTTRSASTIPEGWTIETF